MLQLLSRLPGCGRFFRTPAVARAHHQRLADDVLQEDEVPPGCGWFDSSHELERGLQVCEHGADTAGAALAAAPLVDWLDFQLQGWRAPGPLLPQGCSPQA